MSCRRAYVNFLSKCFSNWLKFHFCLILAHHIWHYFECFVLDGHDKYVKVLLVLLWLKVISSIISLSNTFCLYGSKQQLNISAMYYFIFLGEYSGDDSTSGYAIRIQIQLFLTVHWWRSIYCDKVSRLQLTSFATSG